MGKSIPIKKTEDIKTVKEYFLKKGDYRNYCMVSMLLNTSIRIEPMLSLKWEDVCDSREGNFYRIITVTHGAKSRRVALNREVCDALSLYRENLRRFSLSDYIFQSRYGKGENCPIGRTQVFKLIRKAAGELELEGNISPQSLKKTLGYQAWKQGYRKDFIMDLYNHPSLERTRQYLQIESQEGDSGRLELMEEMNL